MDSEDLEFRLTSVIARFTQTEQAVLQNEHGQVIDRETGRSMGRIDLVNAPLYNLIQSRKQLYHPVEHEKTESKASRPSPTNKAATNNKADNAFSGTATPLKATFLVGLQHNNSTKRHWQPQRAIRGRLDGYNKST